jgi:hypothetical protein
MTWDKDETIELLAHKADGVVRFALGCLARTICYADRTLTRDRVIAYSKDW